MSLSSSCPRAAHRWALRCLTLAFVLWGFLVSAHAQTPTVPGANDRIENQASASYRDAQGQVQNVTSNTTVTTVLQVGSYTLTPAAASQVTKAAQRDSTVYFPYTLTNTGNGTDTFNISVSEPSGGSNFTRIAAYLDDGQGNPASTTALCSITNEGQACSFDSTLNARQSIKFVVGYTVPANADTGWDQVSGVPTNTATLKVKPKDNTTSWFSSYGQTSADKSEDRTDTVIVTNGAIFDVSKNLKAPGFNRPNGQAWPVLTNLTKPTGTPLPQTTYTVTYRNNGANPGVLYMRDVLPAGMSYVAGTAVLSCAPTTALTDASGGDNTLCNNAGIEFEASATQIDIRIPGVPANSEGTLSFIVEIKTTADSTNTTNQISFTPRDTVPSSQCTSLSGCKTNPGSNGFDTTPPETGRIEIIALRKVELRTADTTPGTPKDAADALTIAKLAPGIAGRQTITIKNAGDQADTFNLSQIPTAGSGFNAFPTGTTFVWKFADSNGLPTSNATDSNGDGTVDTGSIAAGQTLTMVLEISLPAGTPIAAPANYQAIALAKSTSYNDTNKAQDAAFINVTDVVGGLVDLTGKNFASTPAEVGAGPGPGATPDAITKAVIAGSQVHEIELKVTNNHTANNSYSLSASANSAFTGSLPTGWSVKFSSAPCSNLAEITNTGTVNAGTSKTVYACVYSPSNSVTISQPLYFKVTGVNAPGAGESTPVDVIYYQVSVLSIDDYNFTLSSRGDMTVKAGGTTVFTYTVSNGGAFTCGQGANVLRLQISLPTSLIDAGWTLSTYLDHATLGKQGSLDDQDTLLTVASAISGANTVYTGTLAAELAARSSLMFFVKVNAPAGVTVGTNAGMSLTLADVDANGNVQQPPDGCGSQGFESKATVSSGVVTVDTVQKATNTACAANFPTVDSTWNQVTQSVKSGGCIYYQVTATNVTASPVTDLKLSTAAPQVTTVKTSSPTPTCVANNLVKSAADGTAALVAPVVSGSQVTCGAGAGTGNDANNYLRPNGTLTLTYAVSVN